eukprot:1086071-Rhodomonas_salina.5
MIVPGYPGTAIMMRDLPRSLFPDQLTFRCKVSSFPICRYEEAPIFRLPSDVWPALAGPGIRDDDGWWSWCEQGAALHGCVVHCRCLPGSHYVRTRGRQWSDAGSNLRSQPSFLFLDIATVFAEIHSLRCCRYKGKAEGTSAVGGRKGRNGG